MFEPLNSSSCCGCQNCSLMMTFALPTILIIVINTSEIKRLSLLKVRCFLGYFVFITQNSHIKLLRINICVSVGGDVSIYYILD